ncbi:MAG: signal peptidase I [Firmicutes bacterium]|nr:signal peptidase I [Bacillota bacterium]
MDKDQLEQKCGSKSNSAFIETVKSVVIAVLLALIIRMFVFEPFYIPSGSMVPTLQVGDRIIVSKLSYHFTKPNLGDIMVFKFPLDPSTDFVKRTIGTAKDTVESRNSELYINDKRVEENYLPPELHFDNFGPVKVPPGNYFMMGDNRNHSQDSRAWGPLPEDNIIGKAVLIYWPLNRIKLL